MKRLLIGLSILCLVMSASAVLAQNLLENPGFEEGAGTPPPPWITFGGGYPEGNNAIFAMETAADRVHSGSKSFSVSGTTETPILGSNGPRQWAIPIDPSGKTLYQLKAWVKKTTSLRIRLRWHQLDIAGNILSDGYSGYDNTITNQWKEISSAPIQIIYGARYLTYTVYVEPNGATNTGSVYIDDCSLNGSPGGVEFANVSGTVTYNGEPVPGAIIGIKQSACATADALMYYMADANGQYGPIYLPQGTVFVAAWKEGFETSLDKIIYATPGSAHTANFTLSGAPGFNMSLLTSSVQYSSHQPDGGDAFLAIDADPTTQWLTVSSTGTEQYLIIDLDPQNMGTFSISGVTLRWSHRFPGSYSVDYTEGNPWPGWGWTTAYSATNSLGGIQFDPDDPFITPIRFQTPITARAIQIYCSAPSGYNFPNYGLYEVEIHSATESMGSIHGYIKDSAGNPIDGALVHLGPNTSDNRFCRNFYTDETGFYSWTWFPGVSEILTADALGYGNVDTAVDIPFDGTSLRKDLVLDTKAETSLVPNWNFEEADPLDPSKPRYWTMMEWDPQGETIFARVTGINHTPGGNACGIYDMMNITDPEMDDKWAGLYSEKFPIKADGMHAYNIWLWRTGEGWETYRFSHRILWLAEDGETVLGGELVYPYGWGRWDAYWQWWRTDPMYRRIPPAGAAYMVVDQIGSLVAYDNGTPTVHAVDDVIVEEVSLINPASNNIGDARQLPDGTRVSFMSKQLTAVGGAGLPPGIAYAQDFDRSGGIRLDATGTIAGDLWVGAGDAINITGVVASTPEGEKYIDTEIVEWLADTRPADALAMNSRTARTTMAQGLFVKLAGKVTSVDTDSFAIVDGNEPPITVYCGDLPKPKVDQFVRVRGVISTDGTNPILLMRNEPVDWVDGNSPIQPLPFQGPVKALRDYLFLGPFGDDTMSQETQMATAFIPEGSIRPSLGDVTAGKTWFRHDGIDELVWLDRVFAPEVLTRRTIYAHVYVWSPVDQVVDMPIGSDDAIRVWVNGDLVWANDSVSRFLNYGQDCITNVPLNAGLNSVLFKVCNGYNDYAQLVSQFAVPGTWLGEGWGGSQPMEGLGYLLNQQP